MIHFNYRALNSDESACRIIDGITYPYEYRTEGDITLTQLNAIAQEGWRVSAIKDPSDPAKLSVLLERGGGYTMICGGPAGDPFAIVGQAVRDGNVVSEYLIVNRWTYGDIAITGLLIVLTIWVGFWGMYRIIRRKQFPR